MSLIVVASRAPDGALRVSLWTRVGAPGVLAPSTDCVRLHAATRAAAERIGERSAVAFRLRISQI